MKEQDTLFNVHILFEVQSYSVLQLNRLAAGRTGGGGSNPLYTWELSWWAYVAMLNTTLVTICTSPVDVYDTLTAMGFGFLGLMYICRPKTTSYGDQAAGAGGGDWMVMAVLMLCIWLSYTSIPHIHGGKTLNPELLLLLFLAEAHANANRI